MLSHVYLVQPEDGTTYMLKAYIAVTLGGWGRVGGAVLGALAIAVFETLVAALVCVMVEVYTCWSWPCCGGDRRA